MNTLFLFTKSPWARRDMEEWLPRVGAQDAVLLIQDAVLALRCAPKPVDEVIRKHRGRVFALEADLVARGIPPSDAEVVNDAGVIRLLGDYRRVVAL